MNQKLIEFATAVLPDLLGLVGDLFARHAGNAAQARLEIRRIRDHGKTFLDADQRNKAEMERLKSGKT